MELEKINGIFQDEDKIPHIRNRYVDVEGELVQTDHFLRNVAREAVTKIIFVFKKDAIVNGYFPCEGMMDTYVLRYRYDTEFHSIGDNECLPFPCCYEHFPTCISYTRRIYSCLYDIRHAITKCMCRNSEKLGRQFIVGNTSFKFPMEGWEFITHHCCENNMVVYGPFSCYKKHMQMRSHLDLNAVKVVGEVQLLQFETRNHFKIFDSLFGMYSWYGSSQKKPGIGKTVQVEEHHHIYSMGSGLYSANIPTTLSKRHSTNFGVDFRFNTTSSSLEISVRYELRRASDNLKVESFIRERSEYDGESMNISLVCFNTEKYNATIKKNAYFQRDGCTYKILDDYVDGATFGTCEVTCSSNDNIAVGSLEVIHCDIIHREVIRFLESMMEF